MDRELHSWKQEGTVSLWRYTEFKNKFDGWHITASDAGIKSLVALIRALVRTPSAHRTVAVTPPSSRVLRVPNYSQGRAQWAAPAKWQLSCSPSPDSWEFPSTLEPSATLAFGQAHLAGLIANLEGIPRGDGDFCMGSQERGNLALWFWWQPSAT